MNRSGTRTPSGTRTRSALSVLACALAFAVAGCVERSDGRTASVPAGLCEPPEPIATLPDVLVEASGIARDPRRDDLFWVHNDSGNPAELYGIDAAGRLRIVVPVAEVDGRDIEDIAAGPCPGGSCLYLADIGDNLGVHGSVFIYRIPLPPLPGGLDAAPPDASAAPVTQSAATQAAAVPDAIWRLVYEFGPRDAEALAIDGRRSELIVISKGREDVVNLYVASLADLRDRSDTPDTLRRVGRLPLPIGANTGQFVTAADLSPDASRLAVRSYTTLYQFDWSGSATFDTLAAPRHVPLLSLLEAQGEGVAWDSAGESLMLVSEGRGTRPPSLSRIRCAAPPDSAPDGAARSR